MLNHDGEVTDRMLWGPAIDQLLAHEVSTDPLDPSTVNWALGDHQGTIENWVDDDGVIVGTADFDEFGRLGSNSGFGSIANVLFGFTGKSRDADTGQQRNGERWYDPLTGRWSRPDPSGLGPDVNDYRYTGNDPVNFTDPTGLSKASPAMNGFSSQLFRWYFGYQFPTFFPLDYPPPDFVTNWMYSGTVKSDPAIRSGVDKWLKIDADAYLSRRPGTYPIKHSGKVLFTDDSISSFVLNESQLEYSAVATVTCDKDIKSVTIEADLLFHDVVDANSFREIDPMRWKSGPLSVLLAIDEGLWDLLMEKIATLGALGVRDGLPVNITWSESFSKSKPR